MVPQVHDERAVALLEALLDKCEPGERSPSCCFGAESATEMPPSGLGLGGAPGLEAPDGWQAIFFERVRRQREGAVG